MRQIKKLPSNLQASIIEAIEQLAAKPRPSGVVKLSESHSLYRIRRGNYRVVYEIQDQELLILIAHVDDRKDIYRGI